MTDHDPYCPATVGRYVSGTGFTPNECQCALITKVRADERERLAKLLYDYADMRDHANEPADVTYGIRLAAHIMKGILRIDGGDR